MAELCHIFLACDHCNFGSTHTFWVCTGALTPKYSANEVRVASQNRSSFAYPPRRKPISYIGSLARIKTWKENFPRFWPKGNHFNAPLTGIAPGEVALLNLSMPVGMRLSTGVMVLYADDESFTLMTPQGHMFAGWITFSSYEDDDCTIAQSQVLIRANDPMYEIGFRLGGHAKEDRFWQDTLTSLAEYFGVEAPVQTQKVCVDPKLQWSQAKNIWHNSAIRTMLYTLSTPLRWVGQSLRRKPETNN